MVGIQAEVDSESSGMLPEEPADIACVSNPEGLCLQCYVLETYFPNEGTTFVQASRAGSINIATVYSLAQRQKFDSKDKICLLGS